MVGQAAFSSGEHLAVADAKRLDPALLAAREGEAGQGRADPVSRGHDVPVGRR